MPWALIQFNKWKLRQLWHSVSLGLALRHRLYVIPHDMMSKHPAIKWSTTSLVSICWTYKSWTPKKTLLKHVKKRDQDWCCWRPNSQPNFNYIVKLELFSFTGVVFFQCDTQKQQDEPCMCLGVLCGSFSHSVFALHAWHKLSLCFGWGPAVVSLHAHALEIRTGEESR